VNLLSAVVRENKVDIAIKQSTGLYRYHD